MDFTGPNVYRGLAGFFLVDDSEQDALPLPGGDRDLPLMICDRAFAADGSFRYPALSADQRVPGVQGSYMGGRWVTSSLSTGPPGRRARSTPPATGSGC